MNRRFIIKRASQAVPVMLGVSFITFSLLNLLPGDTALAILGPNANPISLRVLRQQLGLNEPFFSRYGLWLGHLLRGQLGESLTTNQSIAGLLQQRLPVTAEIVLLAIFLALVCALPVALLAAHRPRAIVDRLNLVLAMVGLSVPGFVSGLLLILIFGVHFRLVPASGYVPLSVSFTENLRSVALPVATLALAIFAGYTRLLRGDLVDQMRSQDYIVVARAKGLSEWGALLHHAFRNSVFPLVTLVGLQFGTLLGATVIVEQVFALPGIGQLLVNAIQNKDAPVVQDITVIAAVVVVVANMIADLVYAFLDPRVRYERLSS